MLTTEGIGLSAEEYPTLQLVKFRIEIISAELIISKYSANPLLLH